MKSYRLLIVTPERQFFDGQAVSASLPATDGYMGILPGHEPAAIALAPGLMRFSTEEGQEKVCAVSHGFAVVNGGMLRLIVQTAEWPEEIDENRVLEARRQAEERVNRHASMQEYEIARAAIARATARLYVKSRSASINNGE